MGKKPHKTIETDDVKEVGDLMTIPDADLTVTKKDEIYTVVPKMKETISNWGMIKGSVE
jgi:hypothetical protein